MSEQPSVSVSHLGLCVTDLEQSLRFYCDGLGFDAAERFELDSDALVGLEKSLEVDHHVSVVSQFIRHEGLAIELLGYSDPSPTGAPSSSRGQLGLTHLAFHTTDLDAAVARLVANGGTVIESTKQQLGVDLVFVADPDGNRVELMEMPS